MLHLASTHQLLAFRVGSGSHVAYPLTPSKLSPTFPPPRHAVLVNTLWSLSLVISLTCALLATLQQRWARRYLKITQRRHHPRSRARIRAFFAEGVDKLRLTQAVEALPTLLHLSLFLFFAGLVVFLFHTDSTVFKFVASWVGASTFLYTCVTFVPIFRYDSPYTTPLSSLAWSLYTGLLYLVFRLLRRLTAFNYFSHATYDSFRNFRDYYYGLFSYGMEKAAEEFALKLPSDIDGRSLLRTLEALDEDDELETFFAGIPGFCSSVVDSYLQSAFKGSNGENMSEALIGFMYRTLSSNLISESVKQRRIKICSKAIDTASLPISRRTFDRILYKDWSGLLNFVEFGLFLQGINHSDSFSAYYSQCVVSVIVATVQEHDARWLELTMHQLGVSESVLRDYLDHGDSLLLANCTHICRRTIHAYSVHRWGRDIHSQSKTLEAVSEFNAQRILPELRNDFCSLWNKIVESAHNSANRPVAISILKNTRQVYACLHQDTTTSLKDFLTLADDDPALLCPSTYPFCNIPGHRSNSEPHVNEAIARTTAEAPHTSTISFQTQTVLHHDSAFTPTTSPTRLTIQHLPTTGNRPTATPQHHTATNAYAHIPLECPHQASAWPNTATPSGSRPDHSEDITSEDDGPFQSTSAISSSLGTPQASFVSNLRFPPTAASGARRHARGLDFTTFEEDFQHPWRSMLSLPRSAHLDAGPSIEGGVGPGTSTYSSLQGAEREMEPCTRPWG